MFDIDDCAIASAYIAGMIMIFKVFFQITFPDQTGGRRFGNVITPSCLGFYAVSVSPIRKRFPIARRRVSR
ncbi:hypothetical protein P167DRAFT_536253 [Morchella conica CCBAS932]|uniref:Uncharacterized protein n=1 Tax=Morchella conica CCBAS932 TaxID=1392247 RepID=A0A3N4KRD7_9PEZI|nr:hypothetical protein P167DRAFT_536253 [Morchella conica CCBAS932]